MGALLVKASAPSTLAVKAGAAALSRLQLPEINYEPGCVLSLPLWGEGIMKTDAFNSRDVNAHSCTVIGATWGTQGRTFDELDDYVDLGNPTALRLSTKLTILVWVKHVAATATWAILMKHNDGADRSYGLWVNPTTYFFNVSSDGGGTNSDLSYYLDNFKGDGTSHQIAVTFDNTLADGSRIAMFRDGSPAAQVNNIIGFGQGNTIFDSTQNVTIARKSDGIWFLPGTIGEVLIYNRALTAGDIMHNYLATKWRYQ